MNRLRYLLFASSIFSLMLASCAKAANLNNTPTSAIEPPPRPTTTQLAPSGPTPKPSFLPHPTKTPEIPAQPLSSEGPWLLFQDAAAIWAINPDGSGLTKLIEKEMPDPSYDPYLYIGLFPAQHGSHVAMIEADSYELSTPKLSLFSLPEGEIQLLSPLLSQDLQALLQDEESHSEVIDIWAAVGVWNRITWSSDGQRLAFNGAQDGPSADLYVYSFDDGSITRLTDGPWQSVNPVWSPDDRVIVNGAAKQLGYDASGSGYAMVAVWAVQADNTDVYQLFASDAHGFELVVGWISNTTLLADTWEYYYEYSDLRTIDVENGYSRSLWHGHYDERAFDSQSGMILISESRLDPSFDTGLEPGLYLISSQGGPPKKVSDKLIIPGCMIWSKEANLFFVYTEEGLLAISPAGEVSSLPSPELYISFPIVAPQGQSWAMVAINGGLWLGSIDGEMEELYAGVAHHPIWSPDGKTLLFLAEEDPTNLFMAQAPYFKSVKIASGMNINRYTFEWSWVWP